MVRDLHNIIGRLSQELTLQATLDVMYCRGHGRTYRRAQGLCCTTARTAVLHAGHEDLLQPHQFASTQPVWQSDDKVVSIIIGATLRPPLWLTQWEQRGCAASAPALSTLQLLDGCNQSAERITCMGIPEGIAMLRQVGSMPRIDSMAAATAERESMGRGDRSPSPPPPALLPADVKAPRASCTITQASLLYTCMTCVY